MKHLIAVLVFSIFCTCVHGCEKQECVVLLHGMGRTKSSMNKMSKFLSNNNFTTYNLGYPSRSHKIAKLAEIVHKDMTARLSTNEYSKINFVTHSLGGIVLRALIEKHTITNIGRVVMLSPPNQGSEVADKLGGTYFYELATGPAGNQLGTGADSVPNKLGSVDFELGVIAGCRSINPILSSMIPGDDDGKVSITRTKVRGMDDFIIVNATHPFIMRDKEAMDETLHFLVHGKFSRDAP